MRIKSIDPKPGTQGTLFVVTLTHDRREYTAIVSSREIQSYGEAQRAILESLGILFRYEPSEGRDTAMADFFWKEIVSARLEEMLDRREAQAAATSQKIN